MKQKSAQRTSMPGTDAVSFELQTTKEEIRTGSGSDRPRTQFVLLITKANTISWA